MKQSTISFARSGHITIVNPVIVLNIIIEKILVNLNEPY